MNARQLFNKTLFTLFAGLSCVGFAAAEGLPSSKATFAYNELISLPSC